MNRFLKSTGLLFWILAGIFGVFLLYNHFTEMIDKVLIFVGTIALLLFISYAVLRITLGKSWLIKGARGFVLGIDLDKAINNTLNELPKPKPETISNLLAHLIYRFTRLGIIGLVVAVIPTWILWIQTQKITAQNILLGQQNTLLERQNDKIDYQINLEESTRRSSLVFLMGNIMDKIDEELKDAFNVDSKTRRLSPQLIGRIVALSQSLKPYRFLDTNADTLTKPYSPERSQLLLSLVNSELDQVTYKEIFSRATFAYADLSNANLSFMTLSGANFTEVDFRGANLSDTDFTNSNLSFAYVQGVKLFHSDFSNANLFGANFSDAKVSDIFIGLGLGSDPLVDFRNASLRNANFSNVNFGGTKITTVFGVELLPSDRFPVYANFHNADLAGANFSNANLTGADLSQDVLEPGTLSINSTGIVNLLRYGDRLSVNFSNAKLSNANLSGRDLSSADLSGADLTDANLSDADLTGADLSDIKGISVEQLSKVRTLLGCKNLPKEVEKKLRKEYPHLWTEPELLKPTELLKGLELQEGLERLK